MIPMMHPVIPLSNTTKPLDEDQKEDSAVRSEKTRHFTESYLAKSLLLLGPLSALSVLQAYEFSRSDVSRDHLAPGRAPVDLDWGVRSNFWHDLWGADHVCSLQ